MPYLLNLEVTVCHVHFTRGWHHALPLKLGGDSVSCSFHSRVALPVSLRLGGRIAPCSAHLAVALYHAS